MAKSKSNPNTSGKRAVVILACLGTVGFVALAAYTKMSPRIVDPEVRPKAQNTGNLGNDVVGSKPIPMPARQPKKIVVLTPERGSLEPKFHRESKSVPDGEDAWLMATNGFLENSGIVPPDARAVSTRLEDRTLVIDFTASFRKSYGSADESAILKGLQLSIGQFPEIDKIRLTVEGKPLDTLGNVDLSEPIDVMRNPEP